MTDKDVPEFDPPVTGGIVVGHDGSKAADRALRWAAEEAAAHGHALHVVRAWVLSSAMRDTGVPFGTVPSFDECHVGVADLLAASIQACVPDGVRVHSHVVHGAATQALIAAAEEADLLVVGERGRGGFAGLRLGSVAEQVMRHAPVTTVVVR
jgi:nucleotide-binding universal stress UspA family protein